ncbi:unnamed protein product [Gongylonema pulchrum]|uniref:EB domain-containing protein n=1 Tax=Gongylonema pulchrum TaxID=637853 RepID=A0A183DUA7_9BILA|nr:unnamed protein product [Gongylonema pulchrum]
MPVCPGQQKLLKSGTEPQYCSPNEPVPCPEKYDCRAASNLPDTYVCCSAPSAIACPPNFTPSRSVNGSEVCKIIDLLKMLNYTPSIHCSPNDPTSCPGGAICMKSVTNKDIHLCCYSSLPRKICPDEQDALLLPDGEVEVCDGAEAECSQSGYTCQVSPELSTWVCCGYPSAMALCADGRETFYQIEGQTYSCNIDSYPTNCPAKYECAPSDQPNISSGYTCQVSPELATWVCCGYPSAMALCADGRETFYQIEGQTYSCNIDSYPTNCPAKYECAPSDQPNISVCCLIESVEATTTSTTTRRTAVWRPECPPGWNPYTNYRTGSTRYCQNVADMRPTFVFVAPICGLWINDQLEPILSMMSGASRIYRYQLLSLIIKVEPDEAVCGEGGFAYQLDEHPLDCSHDASVCPEHYICQPSFTNTKMYCCHEELRCPNGVIPGHRICCPAAIQEEARCLGRESHLKDGNPIACYGAISCPDNYECSNLTTTNEYACCKKGSEHEQICPDNRYVCFLSIRHVYSR